MWIENKAGVYILSFPRIQGSWICTTPTARPLQLPRHTDRHLLSEYCHAEGSFGPLFSQRCLGISADILYVTTVGEGENRTHCHSFLCG